MKQSIEEIWARFGEELKRFIVSKVRNSDIADDILQEVFIKIHTKIDQLQDETKIQPWIYQITRNLIADYYRKIKKEDQKSQYHSEDTDEENSENEMSVAISDMIKMMDELPPEYCEALCLTELDGMNQNAYAEKIGISYTAAKTRVHRARKKLKDMLMRCCHYQFDKYGTVLEIHPANCCCCGAHHHTA